MEGLRSYEIFVCLSQVRNICQWLSSIFVNSFCLARDEKLQKRDTCVSSMMATVMTMA